MRHHIDITFARPMKQLVERFHITNISKTSLIHLDDFIHLNDYYNCYDANLQEDSNETMQIML